MSIFEKEGGKALCVCVLCVCTLGGSGGIIPQEILDFRLSVTASGAFTGTL